MTSLISDIRSIAPARPLRLTEALRVAEVQAARLLEANQIAEPPIPESVISSLPRVQIERLTPIPVSGSAHWARGRWIIVLNGAEPLVRQRFSLAHEAKHVLDGPAMSYLYPAVRGMSSHDISERVADHFAACLLMPRPWVKRAWVSGTQDVRTLARRFGVSQMAMQIRLQVIGLAEPPARCRAA
jgi:Zn-dependent peptidase ImmA (M78 family)